MEQLIAESLIGVSEPMRQLRALIVRVARTTLPVLIQGETGSGKELVARALHRTSGRSGALTALNVCAVADSMFEATLFGHVRGAFTGSIGHSAGYLAEANGGTLFLDEISGLPMSAQAKLLRAVELKEFRPIGASADRRSDFRLVVATNEDLYEAARTGSFRHDLLQRLNGVRIILPPLRSRREDIASMAAHFLAEASRANGLPLAHLDDDALATLREHTWPGNVRELRQVLECARVLTAGEVVGRDDIAPLLLGERSSPSTRDRHSRQNQLLYEALAKAEWDIDRVAADLGVHRATVYRRLKRLDASANTSVEAVSSAGVTSGRNGIATLAGASELMRERLR